MRTYLVQGWLGLKSEPRHTGRYTDFIVIVTSRTYMRTYLVLKQIIFVRPHFCNQYLAYWRILAPVLASQEESREQIKSGVYLDLLYVAWSAGTQQDVYDV